MQKLNAPRVVYRVARNSDGDGFVIEDLAATHKEKGIFYAEMALTMMVPLGGVLTKREEAERLRDGLNAQPPDSLAAALFKRLEGERADADKNHPALGGLT